MKRLLLSALCAVPAFCIGQTLLYNDGATIKVQTGATLYVEGGIQNTSTGTIDNDGTIEVKGNFLNQGTWESANGNPNTLKFSGNVNSDVTPGTAKFYNVVVQKDNNFDVNLLGNMTVTNNLDFNAAGSSKINLGTFDLTMGGAATTSGFDSDEFVVTAGTGKMRKAFSPTGSLVFPVGFDAATYNPATLNVTAGPNDTLSVRVLAAPTDGNGLTGTAITTDAVNAVWDIKEKTPGGNTFDVTLGWAETDELTGFDDNLNAVSRNDGTNGWDGLFADLGAEVGNTRTKTGYTGGGAFSVGDRTLANDLVLGIDVFLQGPYNATADLMTDVLRTSNYIPLTEPYTAAPYLYAHVGYGGGESVPNNTIFDQPANGDDVVDWIVVELRNSTTPGTKLATKTGLLQRDGDIVDLDGISPLKIKGLADGTYHVGLRHRNHITVRTQTAIALSNTNSTLDFKVNGTAYNNGSGSLPMKEVETGVYGLWAGDANLDNKVRVTPSVVPPVNSDRTYILDVTLLGNPTGQYNGYSNSDVNMDGKTRVTPSVVPPVVSDATFILDNVLGGNPTGQITADN